MSALLEKAIRDQVVEPVYHAPLLRDVDKVLRDANIPESALFQSMASVCTPDEIEFIRSLKRHPAEGVYGLTILSKKPATSVLDRMTAMAGACLRNYISARVMTLQDVLTALREDTMPSPSVLLIPNFCIGASDGGAIAEWQVPMLLGLLYNRQTADQQTVIYVHDMKGLEERYGSTCSQYISTHFKTAKS